MTGDARLHSPHYKAMVKALLKAALGPVDVPQAKDIETCLAGVRADKVKEETAAKAAKKGALLCSCPLPVMLLYYPAIQAMCGCVACFARDWRAMH